MPRPRILVSFSRALHQATPGDGSHAYRAPYLSALEEAGGLPVPIGPDAEPAALLEERWDGLVLSGGGDVHPGRFGQPVQAELRRPDDARDGLELSLAQQALEHGRPTLGICRGMQVMGVALGARLIQDLRTDVPHEDRTSADPARLARRLHPIRIEPGSRLGALLAAARLAVTSSHHQAVETVPTGARGTAWAPDGVLEGLEVAEHPFFLGIQSHPEWMLDEDPARRLFRAFVEAAAG